MPPEITISLADYDHMQNEMHTLWETHEMIRKAYRLFNGREMSQEERAKLEHDFDHFIFKYGLFNHIIYPDNK